MLEIMAMLVDKLNEERASNWFSNMLAMRFFCPRGKRNANVWIFSSWEGMRYADNARYLFEWIRDNRPEITCLWQTRDRLLYKTLLLKGIPVQLIGTKEADNIQKNAGVCVCTHGIDDFGSRPSIYGSLIVFLGHGPVAKKLWRSQLEASKRSKIRNYLSDVKWRLFNYMKADAYLACSPFEEAALREALLIDPKTPFIISGLPRNDAFGMACGLDEVFADSFLTVHPYLTDKRVVLYMPTFRRQNDCVITKAIASLANSSEFEAVIKRNNAVLICKMHYLSDVSEVKERDWLILAKDDDVADTQKLLAYASYLITDYSSCAIDFALTGRPICYLYPDGNVKSVDTPMLPCFYEVAAINRALSTTDLINHLDADFSGIGQGLAQSSALNGLFNSHADNVGCFSSTVFQEIRLLQGVR